MLLCDICVDSVEVLACIVVSSVAWCCVTFMLIVLEGLSLYDIYASSVINIRHCMTFQC